MLTSHARDKRKEKKTVFFFLIETRFDGGGEGLVLLLRPCVVVWKEEGEEDVRELLRGGGPGMPVGEMEPSGFIDME